jgi:hypothetical protein
MVKTLGMLLTVAVALTACSKESIRGSGRTVTETRNVASFTEVKLEGSASINVEQGTQQKVEVSGYENLLPIYETIVQNGTLVLKFKNDYYNVRNSNISVNIIIPALSKIVINGSGEYKIKDFNGSNLTAEINGSGEIYTTNCVYDNTVIRLNGSGYVRAAQVQTKEADLEINGSGKIDINCSKNLKATIHGSGQVNYWGSPSVTVNISGSGSVNKQ